MPSPRTLLLFEHIPKTAGTTMHGILWRLYGGRRVYLATYPGRHRQHVETVRQRLADPADDLRALVAHTGFGVHRYLPDGVRTRHLTLLRHPVDRVLSHYHYQIQRGKLDASTTLEAFLRDDLSRAYNVQTAFLGGLEVRRNLDGITLTQDLYTEALLRQAKANLRTLDAFGLTDRFDESLLVFRAAFGWPWHRLFYVRRRVGHRAVEALPAATQRLLYQCNELDLELYQYAQTLFAQQQAAHRLDTPAALASFQRLNAVYSRVLGVVHPVTRPVVHTLRAWKKQIGR